MADVEVTPSSSSAAWSVALRDALPAHAAVVDALAAAVERDDRWRSMLVGCSLGAGRGDDLSDIDAGVSHDGALSGDELVAAGLELATLVGPPRDLLAHRMEGWPPDSCRIAAEYEHGVQLDLALFPAPWRRSRPTEVAIVDKDGDLADLVVVAADVADHRRRAQAREWTMLGWWAVSAAAKYIARRSTFEAAMAIDAARGHALGLAALAQDAPDPRHGLVSILDDADGRLPDGLAATYGRPDHADEIRRAGVAVADLLAASVGAVEQRFALDLDTPWAALARTRLSDALRR